jgi:hypothetical protein
LVVELALFLRTVLTLVCLLSLHSVSHLARLESLRYLNLQNCELAGDLPLFGSSNTKLEIIDLGLNEFEGTIPSSYGHIKNLEELILVSDKSTLPLSFRELD